ncbi:lipopolysaccharide biosynthesis protein [Microbacterium sp. CIAB417]|uniref:lipopolysaccharide biosynthesis protein n=1 Tax=Microbacterium sp. CIAB417 TaxID=2860287 RepID=UPI0020115E8B|nr:lipopolysaccharide biosynthesis protein [Microbacterium sp. CIAB417]
MSQEPSHNSLGRSAARGVLVTSSGQAARLLLQLLGVIILSRMLSPGDFGLLAMITAIVTVGQSIRDFGLSNASIQTKDLSSQQRTNLFWLNTLLGVATGVILFACAPLISSFYSSPELIPVTQAMALTFLLNGVMTQSRAHLARKLQFTSLMLTDVVPAAIGLGAAIGFAAAGAGAWALVAQQIAIAFFGLVLSVAFDRWIPGLPRRAPGMTYFLKYGAFLTLSQIVATLSRNADYVILGYRFGPTPTGFYNRAFELVINPLNQVNAPSSKVAVPVLSRLQDQTDKFNEFLLAGQKAMLVVLLPVLSAVAAVASPLVLLVLGERWAPSIVLLQILIIAGICRVASYASYWIALSRGATAVSLWVNLVSAPVLIACIALGSIWGVVGVAAGFAVGTALSWFIGLAWYGRAAQAPAWRMFTSALVVIAANVLPTICAAGVVLLLASTHEIVQIAGGIASYVIVWAAQTWAVPAFRRDLGTVVRMAKLVRSARPRSS